jgi:hypothetical protein
MKTTTPTPKTTPLMKKLALNFLLLLSVAAGLSSCQKTEADPKAPASVTAAQDAIVTTLVARKSYLFLRTPGPFGFGHTGVGFIIERKKRDTTTGYTTSQFVAYIGAVENPDGTRVIKPGQVNGGWHLKEVDFYSPYYAAQWMKQVMKQKGYTEYKNEYFKGNVDGLVPLAENSNVEAEAAGIIQNFRSRGFNAFGNNCMNASFDVLQALGASDVALPGANWTPKWQFKNTGNDGSWSVPLPL